MDFIALFIDQRRRSIPKHLLFQAFSSFTTKTMEEEIKAKLASLDADTLRQLLHSMIANKPENLTPSDQDEISYDPNLNEASETDHNKDESSEVVEETSSNHDSPRKALACAF